MKILDTLASTLALLAVTGCGGSSAPDADKAEAELAAELAEHGAGKLRLASFEKTDTRQGEMFGVPVVSVGFTAQIEFEADGYWVLGGERAGFELSPTEIWPSEGVTRGEKRGIEGSVDFARTDEGWEANVDLDLPEPGQRAATQATSRQPSPLDLEARAFVEAELAQHWTKGPDGWTTQVQQRNLLGQVMPGLPDTLFRQLRTLEFTLSPEPLSDSQKLNGADYRAGVTFADTSERLFHRVKNWEGVKGWSQWSEEHLGSLAVERRNGEWITSRNELFDQAKPEAEVPATD